MVRNHRPREALVPEVTGIVRRPWRKLPFPLLVGVLTLWIVANFLHGADTFNPLADPSA